MNELENIFNDIDYINIVSNILKDDDFNKIKNCRHHGLTRYDHSLRVSYYSYLVTKKLKLKLLLMLQAIFQKENFFSLKVKISL